METPPPTLDVSHDSSVKQQTMSDITISPPSRKQQNVRSPRNMSIDAKLKQKWKKQIEKERAYEREKTERGKQQQQEMNDSNSSSLIELTKDLLDPCAQDTSTDKGEDPGMELEKDDGNVAEPTKLADLSDSLVDPPVIVSPDDKESHKVLAALDTSTNKQVYSPQEQEYFKFHKQLYAPQEQEYLTFLRDLELEQDDPTAQQKEFADWLKDVGDKDIQPIASVPEEKAPPKKVAFSKETTVRFFSRTREELLQLRRKYKKTVRGVDSLDEESMDEEDWPLFKYLDDKLKEMEESDAWDDPMAVMTNMFVSKEIQQKMSPLICVCEDQAAAAAATEAAENVQENTDTGSVNRSLADSFDDEVLGPAMAVATTKAAAAVTMDSEKEAEKEASYQSQESSADASGISALWFAVPYKSVNTTPDRSGDFLRPVASPQSSASGTDKTGKSTTDKTAASSPQISTQAPESLSLIKESELLQPAEPAEVSGTSSTPLLTKEPEAPKKASLSWLAEELDSSRESGKGGTSMLSADPLNDSALSNEKNISMSSLGRNTNTSLLKKVSEHLNVSGQSFGTNTSTDSSAGQEDELSALQGGSILSNLTNNPSASSSASSSLTDLFNDPTSNVRSSGNASDTRREASNSAAELDASSSDRKAASVAMLSSAGDDNESCLTASSSITTSSGTSVDKKRRVVDAAKRWTAAQKSGGGPQTSVIAGAGGNVQRKKQVVHAAKRWAASQEATSPDGAGAARDVPPSAEDGPDLDESRDWDDEPDTDAALHAAAVNRSHETDVWDGVTLTPGAITPRTFVEDGPDLDESKDQAKEEGIVFDYESKKWDPSRDDEDVACIDSNPWLSAEDGPDLDESKEWNAFEERDITTTTRSMSHSLEDADEWVAFPTESSKTASTLDQAWEATFPEDEAPKTTAAPTGSPRKQVRASPVKTAPSSRVKELTSQFEKRRAFKSPQLDCGVSPLTPSTPWADTERKEENSAEYPDLQQPMLEESRPGSDSSPVSVTHM